MSHQPRLCVTPNLPQNGVQMPKFVVLRGNFDKKAVKVCYKVSLSKIFRRQSYSVIIYLLNAINILAWNDPIPVKFGPKGTDRQ